MSTRGNGGKEHQGRERVERTTTNPNGSPRAAGTAEGAGAPTVSFAPTNARNPKEAASLEREARAQMRGVFGRDLSEREVASLVGAQPGDSVRVAREHYFGNGKREQVLRLYLTGANGRYSGSRTIERARDGRLSMTNESVAVAEKGQGEGTRLFARQLAGLRAAGVQTIHADASREEDRNGYYTLAVQGWDGRVPADVAARAQSVPELADAHHVSQIVSTPRVTMPDGSHMSGAAWWKQYGDTFAATFDTRPASASSRAFDAYLARRASQGR